jgi:hypothetical protein
MNRKKLLSSFIEYCCPFSHCGEKLTFSKDIFYCKKHKSWDLDNTVFFLHLHPNPSYLNRERLIKLKEYYESEISSP